jgi:hypothetical protein
MAGVMNRGRSTISLGVSFLFFQQMGSDWGGSQASLDL